MAPRKPDRRIERSLHQRPVTGMLDPILQYEVRQLGDTDKMLAAQRSALQMSWRLHALVAQQVRRV